MTTTIVFPDRSQWTLSTWVQYLSLKLWRKNVEVCGGTDDDRTLQSIIDGPSRVYKLKAGNFDAPLYIESQKTITGANPLSASLKQEDEVVVKRFREMPDECEQERRASRGQYADPDDE